MLNIDIEWNEQKRQQTLALRGLDFADVARVDWATALTVQDIRQPYAEVHYITFATINGRLCVFAWCYRGEAVRVISLRKANKREQNKYEKS